jgi:hypothetical protein
LEALEELEAEDEMGLIEDVDIEAEDVDIEEDEEV